MSPPQPNSATQNPHGNWWRLQRLCSVIVGTLFNLGLSTVNVVSLATVRRHVGELHAEMADIREQIYKQQEELQTIGQSLKDTILAVNIHSKALNKTIRAVNSLLYVVLVN